MKRLILIAFVLLSSVGSYSQTLVKKENDSTFLTEIRDDDEWALIAKDSLIVGMNCKTVKDNYGIFYQLSFIIQNLTQQSFDFDPSLINVSLLNKRDETEEMRLYTAQGMQKKIANLQMWTGILYGLNAGLAAGQAGYSNSFISGTGGSYYVQTYNAGNAAMANMLATNQMLQLGKQMEEDRKIRDAGYLKKNTIHSGEGISGYMMVKRKNGKEMTVGYQVNGTFFEFKWDLKK